MRGQTCQIESIKMVVLALLPFISLLASARFLEDNDAPVLTEEEIAAINAGGYWQADKQLIEGLTIGKVKSKYRPGTEARIPAFESNSLAWNDTVMFQGLPATFDSRSQWPGCVGPINNEGDCISNWALAATEALSDRLCAQKKTKAALSAQYILNCQTQGSGCDGGTADKAWSFLASTGVPAVDCVSFLGQTMKCVTGKCALATASFKATKAVNVKALAGQQAMQAAIMAGGPIEACFDMYSDLLAYRSGVYVKTSGTLVDTMCVRVVGWGASGAIKYWIAASSFGSSWGQSGYFNYKMGQGGFENAAMAGDPS